MRRFLSDLKNITEIAYDEDYFPDAFTYGLPCRACIAFQLFYELQSELCRLDLDHREAAWKDRRHV
jgi:hypothetical protein